MDKKDTKYIDLNTTLSAVGKAVFVNFYYDFKNASLSDIVIAEKLLRENPNTKSDNQNFRIPRARHIFAEGNQLDALKIIIDSPRVDPMAREKARLILAEELVRTQAFKECVDERGFIEDLNKSIVYTEQREFEYNNNPEPAKETRLTQTSQYQRSKKVSSNALLKARFLCEVNTEHPVFVRKNSNENYTEPHHLVPLFAQKDFPDVNLDREQNIVSLCSHCHNLLHYGADIDGVLYKLYMDRKDLLQLIGIEISYEDLRKYYL